MKNYGMPFKNTAIDKMSGKFSNGEPEPKMRVQTTKAVNSSTFRNGAIDRFKDRFGKKTVTEKMPTLTPKSVSNENAPQKLRTGKFTDKIENLKDPDKTYKEAALQKRPIGKVGNKFDDMISGDAESKKYNNQYLNMSTKLKTLEKPTSVSSSMQNKNQVLRTNSSKNRK